VAIPETASALAEQRATGSGVFPLPTLAHARQSVAAHVALPLGLSSAAKAKLPRHVKSVLLYGAAGTGKSRLTTEAARAAGAAVFDLSPRVIDGLYPGAKGIASLLQMTFKVAKLCAPSVIVMDDAEAVFLTDKKKTKELLESGAHRDKTLCLDAPSRVKKELVKEMKALKKTDRVVLVGHARAPYACLKKDRKALLSFFDARVLTPTPDRATRAALFRETTRALGGGELARGFQLAELVAASGDYGAGAIERAVANALRPRVLAKLKNDLDLDGNISEHALDADAFLKWLALESPVSKTEQGELRDWTRSLPEYAALKKRRDPPPPPDEPLESDAKGKKKGK
jgi:SpoVK/Ycf46/Vps4 family AAA+-type ATPase